MGLTKYKIGELIEIVDERNNLGIREFYGINIKKEFMPTVANIEGLDETKYKVVRKNRFVYSGMQTGRDECIRVSMYNGDAPILVSPAYTMFEVVATNVVNPLYFFIKFLSNEMDRYGAFCSDGSIRSNLDWDVFCDIELELPPLSVQQKYIEIYNALLENQKSYERGLDHLKFVCDAYIENLSRCNYGKLGNYIEKNKKRNVKSVFKKSDIKGFNNEGQFIEPMRLFSGDISTFKIVSKDDFVYNSRINSTIKKLSIVINESSDLIVSPAYESFRVIKNNELYPFYLYMLLQRESFARKVLFNSFGSSTIVFGFDDLCEIDIPIPNYSEQKNIANIYRAYKERWNLNEKLKAQIKDICPILIKGSIEEARKAKEA
jgi:type I restriction enzyme S subunit